MSADLATFDLAARATVAAAAVERHPAGDELDAGALADLVCAPRSELAVRAQAALRHLLPHDALVVVTAGSAGSPVQVAAPPNLSERLAGAEWWKLCGRVQLAHGEVSPLELPDVVGGLRIGGWLANVEGCESALIVGATAPLTLGPRQERAAMQVALLVAARLRSLDVDPAPGTLGFVRAVSAERERIRVDLSSRHSATLSSLLHTLRAATAASGLRNAPAGVAQAIDLASEALMELRASAENELATTQVALQAVYDEVATEARGLAQSAGLRLVTGLDDPDEARVDGSIAQAGRLVTRAAVLNAIRRSEATKLRVHWRLTKDALTVTIADDGAAADAELVTEVADIQRIVAPLRGTSDVDSARHWGTTLTCELPRHEAAAPPDTPAVRRLISLGEREREVLELVVAGLRNREIAERLFIADRTVKFHVSNILQKLEVRSRTEAIALAHAAGITASGTA
jgi:DNA-binding CsgD family transcriptional regulator/signal transduction histidine kinase